MAISSLGVGSGLPLDKLLSDLRKSENNALRLIEQRELKAESKLSAYGTLKAGVGSLNDALQKLGEDDSYGALKATVTGDAISAKATNNAVAGEYSITVNNLATTQTLAANGVADRTESLTNGGSITFTTNGGETKTIDLNGETSLNDLVKAINADKDLGIKATIINDGNPDNPHRLVLNTTTTGQESAISKIEINGGSQELSDLLSYDANDSNVGTVAQQRAAMDASVTINGIQTTSASNTLEDVIDGVTLTLREENLDKPATLKISEDNSVTEKAIKSFVENYNKIRGSITSLTTYDIENQKGAALTGDSTARRLQSDLSGLINHFSSEGDVRSLSQMGITVDVKTGKLEIDDEKLTAALDNNMSDVKRVFAGTNGMVDRMSQIERSYNGTGGTFSINNNSLKDNIKNIQQQYQVTSDRIDQKMENYRKQFSQLDVMIAEMGSMSTYLSQQLSMLGNMNQQN